METGKFNNRWTNYRDSTVLLTKKILINKYVCVFPVHSFCGVSTYCQVSMRLSFGCCVSDKPTESGQHEYEHKHRSRPRFEPNGPPHIPKYNLRNLSFCDVHSI